VADAPGKTERSPVALHDALPIWKGVICIAATNRMDMLDPALLRPGRFGMQIQVDTPDEAGRRAILELYSDSKIARRPASSGVSRSEEHTSELQSLAYLVCLLLLE